MMFSCSRNPNGRFGFGKFPFPKPASYADIVIYTRWNVLENFIPRIRTWCAPPPTLCPMTFATNSVAHLSPSTITFTFACLAIFLVYRLSRRTFHLPPGPKPLPFIGNVHQLPIEHQEKAFAEWGRKYGDIIFIQIFRAPTIIINSLKVAKALLDQRSRSYSDRPRLVLLAELWGFDTQLISMPNNSRFRKQRKWLLDALTRSSILKYQNLQKREAYILLAGLIQTPECFVDHVWRYAAANILQVTYDHRVITSDDPQLKLSQKTFSVVAAPRGPMEILVDFFPRLKHYPTWLPGSSWKRNALEVRKAVKSTLDAPYALIRHRMDEGTAGPCVISSLIEKYYRDGTLEENEEDIKGAGGMMYGAGTETTASTINALILALVRHPRVFQKLKDEVDRVVGNDRLPDFTDRPHMPYHEAALTELFRYHSAVTMGMPHFNTKEDTYEGYNIPAGTTVIANIWAMGQDEETYPNPEEFRPERFLGLDSASFDSINPKQFAFGFGRRLCPGRDLAEATIFLAMSGIAATMNITPIKDDDGMELVPPHAFTGGFASTPKPFKCKITPRFIDLSGCEMN
ncbi:cytochrome P450 family protein [Abortiporus biennis]